VYFWNTRQLALDLQNDSVSEKDQMWYLFVYVVLTTVLTLLLTWIPSDYYDSKMADMLNLGVTVIGVLACYQANSRGDATRFVVRFICLSWPVSLRLAAFFVPLGIVIGLIIGMAAPEYVDPFADGVSVLSTAVYFALIRKWMLKISRSEISADIHERLATKPA